jgi:hypothetical protein
MKNIVYIDNYRSLVELAQLALHDMGVRAKTVLVNPSENLESQLESCLSGVDPALVDSVILKEYSCSYLLDHPAPFGKNPSIENIRPFLEEHKKKVARCYDATVDTIKWLRSNGYGDISLVVFSERNTPKQVMQRYRETGVKMIVSKPLYGDLLSFEQIIARCCASDSQYN